MNFKQLHSDDRGSINVVSGEELKYPELTIFYTKKGKARGGCIHKKSNEYAVIISGDVCYQIGSQTQIASTGITLFIPKDTPHYFVSKTDSIVIEWGATEEEKKEKHPEFRARVDKINGH